MRKLWIVILVGMITLLPSCGGGSGDGSSDGSGMTPLPPAKWTVLVYLASDNDLEQYGLFDMNEMELVGSTDDVNIAVQVDRSASYTTIDGNWTGARRYYITKDLNSSVVNSMLVEDLGEVNMGSGSVLSDFLDWGVSFFPADRYMVILWDHGSGFHRSIVGSPSRNIAFDFDSGDSLSIPELAASIQSMADTLGRSVDVVGMDACLMQLSEVAYELRTSSDIMVGSEELEPAHGWPYNQFLQLLATNPDATPAQLSQRIVSDYIASYPAGMDNTLSAIDLDRIDELASVVDTLAGEMLSALVAEGAAGPIRTALTSHANSTLEFEDEYRDLSDFAARVAADGSLSAAIRSAATAVVNEVNTAVIANETAGSLGDAKGAAIWLPDSATHGTHRGTYGGLDWSTDTRWDNFLEELR